VGYKPDGDSGRFRAKVRMASPPYGARALPSNARPGGLKKTRTANRPGLGRPGFFMAHNPGGEVIYGGRVCPELPALGTRDGAWLQGAVHAPLAWGRRAGGAGRI